MKKYLPLVFIIILITAAGIRLPRLSERPLHTDEAIHAVKLGETLATNGYQYDRYEYHGPTLNYFSMIPAWLHDQLQYSELDEFTLRVVPVFFGLLMIVLLWPLVSDIGWSLVLLACLLTAISPVMVFYSRYYIMEILLVAFTFGVIVAGYRYVKTSHIGWAILTGTFIGLMHATKETCILVWGAMFLSLLPMMFAKRRESLSFVKSIPVKHYIVTAAALIGVSVLFFSSFGSHPRGILDSLLTFTNYFHKAGDFHIHIYPWYWYFQILLYNPSPMGLNWSEGPIFILALFGFYAVFKSKSMQGSGLLKFLAWFTLILTVIYSAIPYKTPWIVLGFWHGFIIMAAVGIVFVYKLVEKRNITRYLFVSICITSFIHLFWLTVATNYKYFDNPYNPWVFSHPRSDVFIIQDKVRAVASCHPAGNDMRIDVICPNGDYWPLPWYLRKFPNIGWWNDVDTQTPTAPLVIISPQLEADLAKKLYELPPPGKRTLYMPLFDDYVEIRPTVKVRGYVEKQLYDKYYYQQP